MACMPVDPDKLTIVHYPVPVLRQKARPVPAVNDEVRQVARRMLELMHHAPGIGLAAPQVGLSWRLFVACPTGKPEDDRVFINPRLSAPSDELEEMEEGCLSLPEINAVVTRPASITIEATDLDGNPFTLTEEGLPARVWQHEYDHLEGVLIIDKQNDADRMTNEPQVRALEEALRKR